MSLVVEDGTGIANADAYASVADVLAHIAKFGGAFTGETAAQEAAIRRATAYIDARHGASFNGVRRRERLQGLCWPRAFATDREGHTINADTVPPEIVKATCRAAIRELAVPNSLTPDYKRGGAIKSMEAGSVSITYADGATPETVMTDIDHALAQLTGRTALGPALGVGRVTRG